jgi:hypothetical protein
MLAALSVADTSVAFGQTESEAAYIIFCASVLVYFFAWIFYENQAELQFFDRSAFLL